MSNTPNPFPGPPPAVSLTAIMEEQKQEQKQTLAEQIAEAEQSFQVAVADSVEDTMARAQAQQMEKWTSFCIQWNSALERYNATGAAANAAATLAFLLQRPVIYAGLMSKDKGIPAKLFEDMPDSLKRVYTEHPDALCWTCRAFGTRNLVNGSIEICRSCLCGLSQRYRCGGVSVQGCGAPKHVDTLGNVAVLCKGCHEMQRGAHRHSRRSARSHAKRA